MACWPFPDGRWWRRSSPRVRFSEAVPLRSDRRDLRHHLRVAARRSRAERKRRVAAGLATLASQRVRITSVGPGVLGAEVVEFEDGTRLWLDVRDGTVALRRLGALTTSRDLYLCRIEPCFGCCWYQLSFSYAGEIGPTVLAGVKQYESKTTWVQWSESSRWHRRRRERHPG